MRNTIYWWIFFWLQVIGFSTAYYFDIFGMLYDADVSYISWFIIACLAGTTIWIGWQTTKVMQLGHAHQCNINSGWFMSELCMMLGMIGTIVGFIFTLVTTLGSGAINDPTQLQAVIADLAKGIGTAGWTTLFGLISALSIKIQMNNLESLYDREEG